MSTNTHPSRIVIVMSLLSVIIFQLLIVNNVYAQNVAITDDESYTAENTAILDVMSTNKGMLVPRLDSSQRVTIASPALGLLVFDTTKNSFMYYNGTNWITIPQLATSAGTGEALFAVVNHLGDTVFAVYHDGVRIFVDPEAKGRVGGFAISGRTPTKDGGKVEYFRVTPDSTRIYVNDSVVVKGRVGGFAISGRTPTKDGLKEYFTVNRDSTRIYIDSTASKGRVGGFAISGRTPTKAGYAADDYFNISAGSAAETVDNEPRVMWYPQKSALLAGEIHVGSADSVGTNSTALGYRSVAMGNQSQAFGFEAKALNSLTTAIGKFATATGESSYAFGDGAKSIGKESYAFGSGSEASGLRSYAFGSVGIDSAGYATDNTKALGDYSFAFGLGSVASGQGAFALGIQDTASGQYSTAIGYKTTSSNYYSTTLGYKTIASEYKSTAIGSITIASGRYSTAMGGNTIASGTSSTAMGWYTNASGGYSTAMGISAIASGDGSTAIGSGTVASGWESTAFGRDTKAKSSREFVVGAYNDTTNSLNPTAWIETEPLFVIGNGREYYSGGNWTRYRSNAITVLKNGNVGIGELTPAARLEVETEDLETTVGSTQQMATFHGYSGNQDNLFIIHKRHTAGTDWRSCEIKIQKQVDASPMHYISFKSNPVNNSKHIEFGYNVTPFMTLDQNGRLGIGDFYPSEALDVIGNINYTGVITDVSDLSLKTDIREIKDVLVKLKNLKGVYYYFKDTETYGDSEQIGLIAQDMIKEFPQLVKKVEKDILGINYIDFSAVLLQAIKEQQQIIEEQQKEITNLKTQMEQIIYLKSELEAIKAELRGK